MAKTLSAPMYGTTGSTFTPVAAFEAGRIGIRDLGNGSFRVRVEPTETGTNLDFPSNWTRPSGSQNRYSTVVKGVAGVAGAVALAASILTGGDFEAPKEPLTVTVNGTTLVLDSEQAQALLNALDAYLES